MNTKELGNLGERIACEYLVKNGYDILERNYRISFGEIDIIAKRKWKFLSQENKTIHFVEVKTIIAGNKNFFPEEKINYKKQRKLRQLSQIWIEKNGFLKEHPYQIDVIGILVDEKTHKAKIDYFSNAVEDH